MTPRPQRPGARALTFARDARFVVALIAGKVDNADPSIAAHLVVMKVRHSSHIDLCELIDRALLIHAAALERAVAMADRSYLRAVATGVALTFEGDVFEKLAEIHARIKGDTREAGLFALAVEAFSHAALDTAAAADTVVDHARAAIALAQQRTRDINGDRH